MFDKKKEELSNVKKPEVTVSTIPSEFYAGTNPVVTFKNVEKKIELQKKPDLLSKRDKMLLEKEKAAGSNQPLHPVNLFSNRRFLIFSGISLFILVIGVSAVYYIFFQRIQPKPIVKISPTTTVDVVPSTSTIINSVDTTSTTQIPTTTTSEASIDFPSILLTDSVDTDTDKLSDKEEEIFNTDIGVADTDNDGYTDGHEVYYLYNPAGKEPMRLIASGLVKEFINPNFNYKLYYPSNWAIGSVDSEYKDVLFSTLTGENIEVRVFEKQGFEDFISWFGKWAPREKFDELEDFASYLKENGRRRKDGLVYYFEDTNHVYVLVYHPALETSIINYRRIIEVMGRSFTFDISKSLSSPSSTTFFPPTILSSTSTELSVTTTFTNTTTSL